MSDAVLIVDDDEQVLESLKRLLHWDGYDIHLAPSGPEALDILNTHEIAAIVCDQRMPGMTGAEVLAEAHRLHPETVRITLTGYSDLGAAESTINTGHVSQFLLKPRDDDHLRSVVADPAEVSGGMRWKILVVDDCALVCNALQRELRPAGIETVSVDSAWHALNLVEQMDFDAAIIDLMMPAMSGEELARRFEQRAPELPCIILTGHATLEGVRSLTAMPNVAGILTKPWDQARLRSTIQKVLAQSETEPQMEPV